MRGEPGGSGGGAEADAGGGISGGFFQEFRLVGELGLVAEDLDGGGADAGVFGGEEFLKEGFVDLVEAPSDPEGFEEMVFVALSCRPFFESGEDVFRAATAEFAAGAVAGAELGEGEIFKEGEEGRLSLIHI